MASLPSPPFIFIEGIHNFRSLGGYRTSIPTSAITRSDLLFRSAEPSQVTAAGIAALKALNIRTIFDLRSLPEIERIRTLTPRIKIEGIEQIFIPVFRDIDYSPEAIARRYKDYASKDGTEGFRRAYADILEHGAAAFRTVLLHVRDKPQEPCLVHCTAGKDRTGILVALILQLVGVEDHVIAEEYALTEVGLAAWKDIILKHLMKDMGEEGKEGAERMIGARAINMLASLEMIKIKYGGSEGYLKQMCGFTDHDIQKIRTNVTESRKAVL